MNKIFSSTILNHAFRCKFTTPPIIDFIHGALLQSHLILVRSKSKSTSIPKKQVRVRDHGFDNYMEVEKKMRKVLKIEALILSQPNQCVAVSRFDNLARRIGYKQLEAGRFVLKFPHIFEVYEHPVQRILYLRLTRKANLQIQQEKQALISQIPEAVTRLRKLLTMSNTGRLRLEHVRIARKEFGLPDDFESSVVCKYPEYFRLFDAKETRSKYIEIVDKDPMLAVCAIERAREMEYRERGIDAENIRFSFIVNFPPGFKISKYYKIAVWKWQRLPYWSPYEDVSGYDMRSVEAQNRMEKRAVATIHELLSLTVEKKITLERIAHFRMAMDLPGKLKDFLLQHQGIFYISTRGNRGKLHTVFLREAYWKGELVEPNGVYLARRVLADLILMSPRKARVDEQLVSYRRRGDDEDVARIRSEYADDNKSRFDVQHFEVCEDAEQVDNSDSDGSVASDSSDEDDCLTDDARLKEDLPPGDASRSPPRCSFIAASSSKLKPDVSDEQPPNIEDSFRLETGPDNSEKTDPLMASEPHFSWISRDPKLMDDTNDRFLNLKEKSSYWIQRPLYGHNDYSQILEKGGLIA